MRRETRRLAMTTIAATLAIASCGGGTDAATTTATTIASSPQTEATPTPTESATPPDAAATEEVRFDSGQFELAGDLLLPGGPGPHPGLIIVHGSGPQTRYSTPGSSYVKTLFSDAGYAVLVWDMPGSGDSTGTFDDEHVLTQRAQILADGIAFLADHEAVDPTRIGVWGISQAGWVMPLALELTDDISFMIVVSGGGEDSIEQMGYQIAAQLACGGLPEEQSEQVARYGPQAAKGTTYELYVEAMEILLEIPGMDQYVGPGMSSEEDWEPWPPEIDAYLDPMDIIERTSIPILAVFGELDKYIDPIQGAAAYEAAFVKAGNDRSHVELIPGAGHTLQKQSTGCEGDSLGAVANRYLELLDEWIEELAG